LDFGVDALGHGVGGGRGGGVDDAVPVALEHARDLDHRRQPAARRPRMPLAPHALRPAARAIAPQRHRHLLQRPGPRDLQVAVAQRGKVAPLGAAHVGGASQPLIARAD